MNDFAKAYGNFTFNTGTFKLAMEASSENGAYKGYIEPVFDHMSIFILQRKTTPSLPFGKQFSRA